MAEVARVRPSVFARLLGIMVTLTVSLLLLVTGFFVIVLIPAMTNSLSPFVDDYAKKIAATQPSFATAKEMGRRLHFDVRYEGPDGEWSTSRSIPPIAEVRRERGHWFVRGHGYHLATAPNGGTYAFRWSFAGNTIGAHYALFALLLVLIFGATVMAHMTIRRLLRPLRSLGDGVARLSAGELDVELPAPTGDEFGALTTAFNEMTGRVREMIRARDRLLLDVSHELRSPLTRLRVAVELLPDERDRARMAADIAEMEAMIAELLELERLRDGKGIRATQQNLAPLVREVVESFDGRAPGVRIVALPPEMIAEVDGEKLRRVLRNLLENAVKFSLPDSRAVEVSAACDDEQVVIRIADDGPGIPEEDRGTIFEPFFRVSRSRAKTPAGYGLGLSICKRIVDAHGGTISVQNNAGRGATFVVTLRRYELEKPGTGAGTGTGTGTGDRVR